MKQPKALYLINFVSMWENFSYYGMRVLLVLFMVKEMRYSDRAAFGLYALYTTLIELSGVVGGIAADRFFGLKKSVFVGAWVIVLGHICLAISGHQTAFFLGLAFVIIGTGLFRSNAAMLLGQFYEENDPRRDAGYTLYYTGINIGGFLATLFCGIVGDLYGWHAGFSLAALGMLSGNLALYLGRGILKEKGTLSQKNGQVSIWKGIGLAVPIAAVALYFYNISSVFVPLIAFGGIYYAYTQIAGFTQQEKKRVYRLAVYVLCLIVFYACEEQLGSSLLLFAERHVDRQTWFGIIPAASLIMFNPLTILITGPLLSQWLKRFPIQGIKMIGISFLLLGMAFSLLFIGCGVHHDENIPLAYVIGSFFLIALGELFMGPTVYAYASEIAPRNFEGLIMGIVTMGFALANLLSGWISRIMAIEEGASSLQVHSIDMYSAAFGWIGALALVLSLAMLTIKQRKVLS